MGLFSALGTVAGFAIGGPAGAQLGAGIGSAVEASSAASKAGKAAVAASDAALQFQKDTLQEFRDIYGDIEINLGEFFTTLTPDNRAALKVEDINVEFEKARTRLDVFFAQSGLTNISGAQLEAETLLEIGRTEAKAGVRATAEQEVREEQLAFLKIGLPQKRAAVSGIGAALGSRAQITQAQSIKAQATKEKAFGSLGETFGEILEGIGAEEDKGKVGASAGTSGGTLINEPIATNLLG